jgi:hypothetical protein
VRAIGFWFSPQEVLLPRPQRLVDPGWARDERAAVASYLRAGAVVARYRGLSWCRFRCGIASSNMGSTDLGDAEWIWPEGLAHYVEAHGVRLPSKFIERALALRTPDAPPDPVPDLDTRGWRRWGSAKAACVTFARGWSEIGFQDASSMYKQLVAAGAREPTMLARREDGDAVLCSDFRVLSLRTGALLASASDDDEASFDRAAGVPAMAVPTEAELRTWAAEMVARPPREKEVETVVAWVPDGLAGVVEQALASGRFILLGAQPGTGGAWLRFYREP